VRRLRSALLGFVIAAAAVAGALASDDAWNKVGKALGKAADLRSDLKLGHDNEAKLGREVAQVLVDKFGLYQGEDLTRYVNLVGLSVARKTARKGIAYRFGILDTNTVNAYAAPGGYVFVTKGLLRRLKSEGQLAGILAHEIIHVDRKHALNAILKGRALGELGKLASKNSKNDELVKGIVEAIVEKGLPKADEYDADARGVPLASTAGYRPSGLPETLKELFSSKKDPGLLAAWNSTHPSTESRLQKLEKVLAKLPDEGVELPDRYKKRVRF